MPDARRIDTMTGNTGLSGFKVFSSRLSVSPFGSSGFGGAGGGGGTISLFGSLPNALTSSVSNSRWLMFGDFAARLYQFSSSERCSDASTDEFGAIDNANLP